MIYTPSSCPHFTELLLETDTSQCSYENDPDETIQEESVGRKSVGFDAVHGILTPPERLLLEDTVFTLIIGPANLCWEMDDI